MGANLAIVTQKQDNLTIKAPVGGHLTSLNAEIGQLKSSGERLGQIDTLSGFKLLSAVDEHYIARIADGCNGEFDLGGTPYRVAVEKVYPEVRDGRFDVDLVFDGPEPEGIRRGQRLRVRLELGHVSEATLLPRGAFFETTGGGWAFVLDADGTSAQRRRVQLGRQNPEVFEVLAGLGPGDRVITSSYEGFGDTERLILD
jgi:HlyD family secretion protein